MKERGKKGRTREAAVWKGLNLVLPALKMPAEDKKPRNGGWFLEAGTDKEQILS